MNVITKSVQLPDGRTITIETGKVAKQADGAAVLRMGNTVLLATVCAAKDAVPGTDFMPLQVDYREQYSAAGRFPGGFTKREGKASDEEILTSRLVDRALRPLFPSNYHAEVYVQVMLLSADGVDQPDALAGFAASAAMACSDIPFEYYISEVRVARINGEYVVNPTFQQMEEANGFVASYIHAGGKIGVLVDVETDVVNDAVKEMAKNVAMQAAALKPLYTSDAEVEPDYIEKEKAILMAQIQNDPKESQKPEKVIQGMIQGRINKELKEICLLDQVYVKAEDGKQSVGKYVEQVAKENNAKITIKGFVRFETGEGIEKKEENFAEEVAKQMAGN